MPFDAQADFATWDEGERLILVRAMIDADAEPGMREMFVGHLIPATSPTKQQGGLVPSSVLRTKAICGDVAQGEQDVGVGIVWVVPVYAYIGDHALGDKLPPYEIAQQRDLFIAAEFDG